MNFVEFLGFVISLAAMIFLVIKKTYEESQRRKNPEEYARKEREREENLRRFLQERGIDSGETKIEKPKKVKSIALPPKMVAREQQKPKVPRIPQQSMSTYHTERTLEYDLKPAEAYEVLRLERPTGVNLVVKSLKSPREMLIIKEIFDKPLSMR